MTWPRSAGADLAARTAVAAILAVLATLAWPVPPQARAGVGCDLATGPAGVVTGAVGLGNPAGDVCNEVAGAITAPVTGAVSGVVGGALKDAASGVFGQLTTWVSEGAGYLMGQVVSAIDESTTPQLDTEGFLSTYARMAAIAAVMACAMLLLAILEGIAQGSPGLLLRVVFLNVPLAFLGTSIAFAIVQLLLGVTDELSHAVADASHHGSTHFFEAAIHDLGHVGGEAGKKVAPEGTPGSLQGDVAGHVAVPLFVGFLAAILGALAAFCVWIELAFRDAAVYVVAVFMPLSLAASIWPRWNGVLRKSGEILVALIGSKFVIVVIVTLAAGLIAEDSTSVEHVLAAAVMMLLACFSPFVLFRLIPFSEGAMTAALDRRSVPGQASGAVAFGSNVQMIRHMSGGPGEGSGQGVSLWSASGGQSGGGPSGPGPAGHAGGGPGPAGSGSGGASKAGGGAAGEAAAAGAANGGAAAVPAAASGAARGARDHVSRTADEGSAAVAGSASGEQGSSKSHSGSASSPRPPSEGDKGDKGGGGAGGGGIPDASAARPSTSDPSTAARPASSGGSSPGGSAGPSPSPQRPSPEGGSPGPASASSTAASPPSDPSPAPGGKPPRPAPERPRPGGHGGERGGAA